MRQIGFSVVIFDQCEDNFYENILSQMLDAGVTAVELNLPAQYERVLSGKLLELVRAFSYRAVHAPQLITPRESEQDIARCQRVLQAIDAHALTVHPDSMHSWGWLDSAFDGLAEPENMDIRKDFATHPEDMRRVFQELPDAKMTLDTNHLLTLGDEETASKAARALHGSDMPPVGHYHLSGLHGLQHVGLDKVSKAQLAAQFSFLLDPKAPLILETRGTVEALDAKGVTYKRFDLTDWKQDYDIALCYLQSSTGTL